MTLRLLLFKECNRACRGCCNEDWDLDSLEIEDSYTGYDEIILTGGEPMLRPRLVKKYISRIRQETNTSIYLYTAKVDNIEQTLKILNLLDGITVTLHEQKDVKTFLQFNKALEKLNLKKSLRLNIFAGIEINTIPLKKWIIKSNIEWIEDCPLPQHEVFKRGNFTI